MVSSRSRLSPLHFNFRINSFGVNHVEQQTIASDDLGYVKEHNQLQDQGQSDNSWPEIENHWPRGRQTIGYFGGLINDKIERLDCSI